MPSSITVAICCTKLGRQCTHNMCYIYPGLPCELARSSVSVSLRGVCGEVLVGRASRAGRYLSSVTVERGDDDEESFGWRVYFISSRARCGQIFFFSGYYMCDRLPSTPVRRLTSKYTHTPALTSHAHIRAIWVPYFAYI